MFELTHPSMKLESTTQGGAKIELDLSGEPIVHPNQYFELSFALVNGSGEIGSSRWTKGRVGVKEEGGEVKAEKGEDVEMKDA